MRASLRRAGPPASLLSTDLVNWWNVADALDSWRTYGVGDPMPTDPSPEDYDVVSVSVVGHVWCVCGVS